MNAKLPFLFQVHNVWLYPILKSPHYKVQLLVQQQLVRILHWKHKKEYPKLIGRSIPIKNLYVWIKAKLKCLDFLLKLKLIESQKTSVKTEIIELRNLAKNIVIYEQYSLHPETHYGILTQNH